VNTEPTASLSNAQADLLPQIEKELQDIARSPHPSLGAYYGMMHYHLGWTDENLGAFDANPGKRLRPLLCLLSCGAAGGDVRQALPAAAAVELVHNFSLVHDDIQDESHTRRGRRAVWDIWGSAHGINVGDGLFVLARLALHRLADLDVPLSRQQSATLALDRACLALCEGQYFDMTFEERTSVDLDQYLWMIRHKTAALLAAAAELGAIIATDRPGTVEHHRKFGENLGMAFQIQDDILGIWGDEQITGKSAATDIRDRKKTLPVVYALRQDADPDAASRIDHLYTQMGALDQESIQEVIGLLESVGAQQHAEKMARRYYRQALDHLDRTGPVNDAQTQLRELAASLLGRET
jgi:geranylgeranyl diphosphate synthase type I